ncbi:hypothetical protein [Nocardioides sp. CER19]|uniref:hypothetical protein n=1 Tax=Nocardioides sp. CER19 TaxID=3038538 RepID=UPI00244BD22A|nr:hypothetical protein [Nocardioides sp. CER19]MDH2416107.1 hypothetical protein [Nocardioides sp. CER19]
MTHMAKSKAKLYQFGAAPTPATTTMWFVAAPFAPIRDDEKAFALPAGVVAHAKQMGTTQTACGRSALTWHRIWTRAFPEPTVPSCKECLRAIGLAEKDVQKLGCV